MTMKASNYFLAAFAVTSEREGLLSNEPVDPGGQTYRGVSRVFWPGWAGWAFVDRGLSTLSPAEKKELDNLVSDFYRVNFWNQVQGDKVAAISFAVAEDLFDTAVNMGIHPAVCYLQEGLNLLNLNQRIYPDILVDGKIGSKTLDSLNHYCVSRPPPADVATARLLRVMNTLQGYHYIEQMRKHPQREIFRGWFDRI